jgi:hypothetical protein
MKDGAIFDVRFVDWESDGSASDAGSLSQKVLY